MNVREMVTIFLLTSKAIKKYLFMKYTFPGKSYFPITLSLGAWKEMCMHTIIHWAFRPISITTHPIYNLHQRFKSTLALSELYTRILCLTSKLGILDINIYSKHHFFFLQCVNTSSKYLCHTDDNGSFIN